jgi:two-component system sensor histidine kinase RegB
MSGRAGSGVPAPSAPLPLASIVDLAKSRLTDDQSPRLSVEMVPGIAPPLASGAETTQVLSSLLKNAFEASDPSATVTVRALQRDGMVRIEVHDIGSGMSPETVRRAGEPFYTTKEPGRPSEVPACSRVNTANLKLCIVPGQAGPAASSSELESPSESP